MKTLLTLLLFAASLTAATAQTDSDLQTQLTDVLNGYQGKVALYATDLRTNKTIAIDADTPVQTASTIKLAILFEALKQIQEGRHHWNDALTLRKQDQVDGSGVLQFVDTPHALTLKDALTMMIIVSDNTGTNLAIDALGRKNIDDRLVAMGLKDTWLYKKVFTPATEPMPPDQPKFGLGKTTAREMTSLMRRIISCDLGVPSFVPPTAADKANCRIAIDMLQNQSDNGDLVRSLSGYTVANKTGALTDVRNDVAAVYVKGGPIFISMFTYDNKDTSWTPDNTAQILMGKVARIIVDRWK